MKLNKFKNKAKRKKFLKTKKSKGNPLFDKTKQRPHWKKLNSIFAILIFFGLIYLVFFSPLLKINNINIQGPESYDKNIIKKAIKDQLNSKLIYIFPQDNLILFSKDEFYNAFSDNPYLKQILIKKKIFNTLQITYQIREPKYVIFNKAIYWSADDEGYILSVLEPGTDLNGPRIYDPFHNFRVTDRVTYSSNLTKYEEVWDDFKYRYEKLGFTPQQINLLADNTKFELITNQGWKVMFSTDYSLDKQLNILYQLLSKKIQNLDKLNYIDLRIENWIYYQ